MLSVLTAFLLYVFVGLIFNLFKHKAYSFINICGLDFRVSGVMADFPENSHFHFDMLCSLTTYKDRIENTNWFNNSFQAYKAANTDPVNALKHE